MIDINELDTSTVLLIYFIGWFVISLCSHIFYKITNLSLIVVDFKENKSSKYDREHLLLSFLVYSCWPVILFSGILAGIVISLLYILDFICDCISWVIESVFDWLIHTLILENNEKN